MMRHTATSRDVRGGCFACHGTDAHWHGPQAQGTAARHHDATGHQTWVDVYMSVRYGKDGYSDFHVETRLNTSHPGSADPG